jgi:hypothetical protein
MKSGGNSGAAGGIVTCGAAPGVPDCVVGPVVDDKVVGVVVGNEVGAVVDVCVAGSVLGNDAGIVAEVVAGPVLPAIVVSGETFVVAGPVAGAEVGVATAEVGWPDWVGCVSFDDPAAGFGGRVQPAMAIAPAVTTVRIAHALQRFAIWVGPFRQN